MLLEELKEEFASTSGMVRLLLAAVPAPFKCELEFLLVLVGRRASLRASGCRLPGVKGIDELSGPGRAIGRRRRTRSGGLGSIGSRSFTSLLNCLLAFNVIQEVNATARFPGCLS